MPDYKSMYFALAAQVADAVDLLIKAQQEGEEAAIEKDYDLKLIPTVGKESMPDHEDKRNQVAL